MNNYINYYYELYPQTISKIRDSYFFIINNEKYYLVPYQRSVDELDVLIKLNKEMINRGSLVHEIILTKDNNATIIMDNTNYSLLRVYINENERVRIQDVLFMLNDGDGITSNNALSHINWVYLWEVKIDYFEYHIGHLIKKYPYIYKTIDYYIGLGENAIAYAKSINGGGNITSPISIGHKRIGVNSTLFDLYNPFNLIIDYKVRDIAEYIKDAFFTGSYTPVLLNLIFRTYFFDNITLQLFFARLLFPSYYFDLYENIVEKELNENIVTSILKKASLYEDFLKQFSEVTHITQIQWLNKSNAVAFDDAENNAN